MISTRKRDFSENMHMEVNKLFEDIEDTSSNEGHLKSKLNDDQRHTSKDSGVEFCDEHEEKLYPAKPNLGMQFN